MARWPFLLIGALHEALAHALDLVEVANQCLTLAEWPDEEWENEILKLLRSEHRP